MPISLSVKLGMLKNDICTGIMYDYTIHSRAKHDLEQICSNDRHNDVKINNCKAEVKFLQHTQK